MHIECTSLSYTAEWYTWNRGMHHIITSAWCVFMQSVRTNNDVEGWHHRLNSRAGRGQIQFYMLLRLLHQESEYVEVQTTLVRGNQCSRIQRKEYRRVNEAINKLWDEFNQGAITSCQLLARVAKIYGPKEESDASPEEDRHCWMIPFYCVLIDTLYLPYVLYFSAK